MVWIVFIIIFRWSGSTWPCCYIPRLASNIIRASIVWIQQVFHLHAKGLQQSFLQSGNFLKSQSSRIQTKGPRVVNQKNVVWVICRKIIQSNNTVTLNFILILFNYYLKSVSSIQILNTSGWFDTTLSTVIATWFWSLSYRDFQKISGTTEVNSCGSCAARKSSYVCSVIFEFKSLNWMTAIHVDWLEVWSTK